MFLVSFLVLNHGHVKNDASKWLPWTTGVNPDRPLLATFDNSLLKVSRFTKQSIKPKPALTSSSSSREFVSECCFWSGKCWTGRSQKQEKEICKRCFSLSSFCWLYWKLYLLLLAGRLCKQRHEELAGVIFERELCFERQVNNFTPRTVTFQCPYNSSDHFMCVWQVCQRKTKAVSLYLGWVRTLQGAWFNSITIETFEPLE